jgi:hypothetical protein
MKKSAMAARLLLGLIYFVFGLNGFLNFIPMQPMPQNVMSFFGALMATGYFFPVLKATETVCGALLLMNMYPRMALIILAPITLQIFLFHMFMTPGAGNLVLPAVMVFIHGYLGYVNWPQYKFLLAKK